MGLEQYEITIRNIKNKALKQIAINVDNLGNKDGIVNGDNAEMSVFMLQAQEEARLGNIKPDQQYDRYVGNAQLPEDSPTAFGTKKKGNDSPTLSGNSAGQGNAIMSYNAPKIEITSRDGTIIHRQNGTRTVENGCLTGTITLNDTDGNPHTIQINISSSVAYNKSKIIEQLTKSINGLSPEARNDLFNEIQTLNIVEPTATHAGGFDPNAKDTILLGFSENVAMNGVTSSTLTHEIGHAVDYVNGEFSSQSEKTGLQIKLDNLKKLTGMQYDEKDVSTYFLSSDIEFMAEYHAYLNGGYQLKGNDAARYKLLDKIAKSSDRNVRNAFMALVSEYSATVSANRSLSPEQRQT